MSLFRRAFQKPVEERSGGQWPVDVPWYFEPTTSGVVVTASNAARSAAVTACQRVLTTSVALLPIDVVRSTGNRRIRLDPPAIVKSPSSVVRRRPFVGQLMKSMTADGNAYCMVGELGPQNRPVSMETIHWNKVAWHLTSSKVRKPHIDGVEYDLWPIGPVLHIPASPFIQPGSAVADSPVDLAKESIGAGLAAERFGAQFFGDGTHPTSIVYSDRELTKDQAETIKSVIWDSQHGSRRPAVFGAGLKVERQEINPEDSQFIDLMRFEIEQVCRFFGVPPSMCYLALAGQNVTYANVSQADLQYLKHSLGIWLADIEDAWSELLPDGQSVKFNVDALLRVDPPTRHDVYKTRLESKTMTVNEVRALEDEEPFTDPQFDEPGLPSADTRSLSAAEVSQKVYLAVAAGVLNVDEARQMIAAAGADIDPNAPVDPAPQEDTSG